MTPSERAPARRRTGAAWLLGLTLTVTGGSGCVSQRQHDVVLRDLQKARAQSSELARKLAALEATVATLQQDVADRDGKLAEAATTQADLSRKLDDLTLMNAELAERLRKAGQSVEQLATERGSLSSALADTRRRLEELSKLQAVAEARAAQFRDLQAKLQKMVDAGQLRLAMRDGRMLLQLPNDVLFDSAKTDVKPVGRATLAEVAKVLATMPERRFQVAGHTDDVKIQGPRFASNWELSTARAVEVTKLLVASGLSPKSVSAAGYGEFDPIAPNDAADGRAQNRRIEISLVPNLDELVKLPEPRK